MENRRMILFSFFSSCHAYFLKYFIEFKYYDLALTMLPISLISLIINSVSGVFSSALEGVQKNYSKNILIIKLHDTY